ncbi:hypothetical protein PLEOSDRAFT_1100165 [Pleurotus ostreatus PC15]|uniref:Uncharacterized protein n=1 Tax=Pleurotus ostreatus (strain PC15) TaxID=1137138 RepID=A0A067P247_PLEO1|nr:hypothetical protein PLEOSDRAFT_1100165 [Pleurotus ostreatus PC15]
MIILFVPLVLNGEWSPPTVHLPILQSSDQRINTNNRTESSHSLPMKLAVLVE